MADLVDLKKKYGKLTILRELEVFRLPSGQTNRVFECLCECNNIKRVRWLHLKRGMNHEEAINRPIRIGNYSKTNFKNRLNNK